MVCENGKNLKLKAAIVASGLTQYQVADLIGMSERCLSHLINGRKIATPEIQAQFANLLDIDIQEVFPPAQS
jgi:plasmid maintenance system antidote protein VapI